MNSFVRAVWSDLIIASYAVPDAALMPLLPPGLTLDRWRGQAHVSLVAFRFRRVRVLGVPAPAPFGDFPQWNLRFYVRLGEGRSATCEAGAAGRGIVFVREFVPSRPVAAAIRLLYDEPYRAAPLACRVTTVGALRRVRYGLEAGGRRHTLAVSGLGPAAAPETDSAEAFFTGQGWGFGRGRGGVPRRFQVMHPPWRVYGVQEADVSVDFERLYGAEWSFLEEQRPASVVLCEGSAVGVSGSVRG